ncbi:hypothetical protein ACFVMC_07945 [Nocardia sp. NPDC127579]|uniref:hypothetical protein n=1 Tax=Nocardia sp. NPDC127579 TaxID=3345402 RepID=UPI0036370059
MNVDIFVLDGTADFGFTGLLETFAMANSLRAESTAPPRPWQVRVVSLGASVRTRHTLAELRSSRSPA